jgi:hypothetical protein
MKHQQEPSNDAGLRELLQHSRPAPSLPPRFQESVWRRIGDAQSRNQRASLSRWLDHTANWLLEPRYALASVVVLLLLGITLGVIEGSRAANTLAKQQYLVAVGSDATR